MMLKLIRAFIIFSPFLFILPVAGKSNEMSSRTEHPKTILDEVLDNSSLSTLAKLIVQTNLVEILEDHGPYTLFAPSNEAFAKLSPGTLDEWINEAKLTEIFRYHIVLGKITLEDLKKNKGLMTLQGQHVNIKVDNNKVTVNNATVVKSHLEYPNGSVYIIDKVLIPKSQYPFSPQKRS